MEYKVLSPWAEVDDKSKRSLQPRLKDLEGKKIGLFVYFKEHGIVILKEVERQLKEKFPTAKFSLYQYPRDLTILSEDDEYSGSFREWVKEVDAVISSYGDAGSCAMFLAKNTAFAELLGKPAVMITDPAFVNACQVGASTQKVPGLRLAIAHIPINMSAINSLEGLGEAVRPYITPIIDDIVAALTRPLTSEEESPTNVEIPLSGIVFKGDLVEVNNFLYKSGMAYGMPIMPPTEDAVKEMLTGTDLPPDHVVARIPPMMGKATVEKIAINAVMAGCLPTYMPLLIAAVQCMVDFPRVKIEGYSCSAASWFPLWTVNGPIRHDLNLHSGSAVMSPYFKPNATIAHATGLITLNIAGVRCGIEDMAKTGHEGRFGVCIAENEEESPWEPLHVYYGLNREDNAITNTWPRCRQDFMVTGAINLLRNICDNIDCEVFDPGSTLIVGPETAKSFSTAGFTRKDVLDYLVEYARRPQPAANPRWNIDNHHIPEHGPILSMDPTRSLRKFWSSDHLVIVVAGTGRVTSYNGGGDHGGPITKKVELPANWNKLVAKYKDIVPNYIRY